MIRSPPDRRTQGIPTESACRPMPDHDATLSFGSVARSPITIIASGSQISFGVVVHDRGRVSPRHATFFSCSCKQRRQKNTTRLSASLRCAAGKPASRHSVCGAAKLALRCARRSNTLPQVRARCNAVLRQRCPQPEPRAAGADTRVNSGADGLRGLWRNWL